MQIHSNIYFKFNNSFLNGQGNSPGTIKSTQVKQYLDEGQDVPYVSAQAYRRWIRSSIAERENQYNYYERLLRKKSKSEYKKLIHIEGDPIQYLEDDLLGYSRPFINFKLQPSDERLSIASTNRHSPLGVSSITPLDKSICTISTVEGFVHLPTDTPLPYRVEFSSGVFQATMNLDLNRVGVYTNQSDIFELDPFILDHHVNNDQLVEHEKLFELSSLLDRKIVSGQHYFDLLLEPYADVKATQFATDLTPRLIVSSILDGSSSIFSNLLSVSDEGLVYFDKDHLKSIIEKRGHILHSEVYIGYRTGFLESEHEEELLSLDSMEYKSKNDKAVSIHVSSPGEVRDRLMGRLREVIN